MSLDLSIGRGDNAPILTWVMPFDVAGSDFRLTVQIPGSPLGTPSTTLALTVSGGGLLLDPASNIVTWSATSAQTATLQPSNLYTLRQIAPQTQYRAAGRIFGRDGPVGPSQVTVVGDAAGPPSSTALDQSIGRGDNAPAPRWAINFPSVGSIFTLELEAPGGIVTTLSTADGSLLLDTVANTVTWPITTVQSAALPYTSEYVLRRVSPEVRAYAAGRIFGVDGPVRTGAVAVQVAGPMGPEGPAGATGPKGDRGDPGTYPIYTAAAVISGDKPLMFVGPGIVIQADPNAIGYVYAGLALNAAQPGASVTAVTSGDASASFWDWTPMAPVFVAPGNFTQTPPSSGRSHLIGWALDAHTIHLLPDPIVTFA